MTATDWVLMIFWSLGWGVIGGLVANYIIGRKRRAKP